VRPSCSATVRGAKPSRYRRRPRPAARPRRRRRGPRRGGEPLPRRQAEGRLGALEGDALAFDQQPLEQRLRVAHGAVGRACHQRQRVVVGGDPGLRRQPRQLRPDLVDAEPPEAEVLAAREHRRGQLLRLGRREDEHQARRRLLERLEQGVGGGARQHVGLVEHPHAAAAPQRGQANLLAQVADVVDRVVRRRVELDDVRVVASLHQQARLAVAARTLGGGRVAVDRHGEQARRGRLAHAARSREEVGVPDASQAQRGQQHVLDVLLTDDLVEATRARALVHRRHRRQATTVVGGPRVR
jgi:hypothetical protein